MVGDSEGSLICSQASLLQYNDVSLITGDTTGSAVRFRVNNVISYSSLSFLCLAVLSLFDSLFNASARACCIFIAIPFSSIA